MREETEIKKVSFLQIYDVNFFLLDNPINCIVNDNGAFNNTQLKITKKIKLELKSIKFNVEWQFMIATN